MGCAPGNESRRGRFIASGPNSSIMSQRTSNPSAHQPQTIALSCIEGVLHLPHGAFTKAGLQCTLTQPGRARVQQGKTMSVCVASLRQSEQLEACTCMSAWSIRQMPRKAYLFVRAWKSGGVARLHNEHNEWDAALILTGGNPRIWDEQEGRGSSVSPVAWLSGATRAVVVAGGECVSRTESRVRKR